MGQRLFALKSLGCGNTDGPTPLAKWRCYAANDTNRNHSAYRGPGCCYCTRPELHKQLVDCLGGGGSPAPPDDPPPEHGDCVRDGANRTRLYNVAKVRGRSCRYIPNRQQLDCRRAMRTEVHLPLALVRVTTPTVRKWLRGGTATPDYVIASYHVVACRIRASCRS